MAIAYTVNSVGGTSITGPIKGTSSTPANITVDSLRPYTLLDMDVDTALTLNAVTKKLQIEATLDEVFLDVGAEVVFTGKKVSVPDAAIMKLKTGTKGEHSQVIPLLSPLAGPGRGGTGEGQLGYERGMVLQFMKAYYNEYSQAIAGEEWGVGANEVGLFNLYGQIQPMLSKWFAEDEGKQYREALVQTYAWPLTKAGANTFSGGLTQRLNANFVIANTAMSSGSQPAWTWNTSAAQTELDYIGRIGTAMAAADTGTSGSNANLDIDFLIALDDYVQNNLKLTPMTIGGRKSYVVLLPSPQYKKMLTLADGKMGGAWELVSDLTQEERNLSGIVGRIMSLVIIEDQRYPTLEFTNPYTDDEVKAGEVVIEYVEPGNDDNRNKAVYNSSSNAAWDLGIVMGAPALIDWTVTPLHFEMDKQNYGKTYGKGAFIERGIQLARYTNDTGNVNVNRGSAILAFTATSLVSVA
jgi:hypothetical protein